MNPLHSDSALAQPGKPSRPASSEKLARTPSVVLTPAISDEFLVRNPPPLGMSAATLATTHDTEAGLGDAYEKVASSKKQKRPGHPGSEAKLNNTDSTSSKTLAGSMEWSHPSPTHPHHVATTTATITNASQHHHHSNETAEDDDDRPLALTQGNSVATPKRPIVLEQVPSQQLHDPVSGLPSIPSAPLSPSKSQRRPSSKPAPLTTHSSSTCLSIDHHPPIAFSPRSQAPNIIGSDLSAADHEDTNSSCVALSSAATAQMSIPPTAPSSATLVSLPTSFDPNSFSATFSSYPGYASYSPYGAPLSASVGNGAGMGMGMNVDVGAEQTFLVPLQMPINVNMGAGMQNYMSASEVPHQHQHQQMGSGVEQGHMGGGPSDAMDHMSGTTQSSSASMAHGGNTISHEHVEHNAYGSPESPSHHHGHVSHYHQQHQQQQSQSFPFFQYSAAAPTGGVQVDQTLQPFAAQYGVNFHNFVPSGMVCADAHSPTSSSSFSLSNMSTSSTTTMHTSSTGTGQNQYGTTAPSPNHNQQQQQQHQQHQQQQQNVQYVLVSDPQSMGGMQAQPVHVQYQHMPYQTMAGMQGMQLPVPVPVHVPGIGMTGMQGVQYGSVQGMAGLGMGMGTMIGQMVEGGGRHRSDDRDSVDKRRQSGESPI
ncbi:hypothetical protein HDU93_005426 [Gonapodya sp. JEL0774]|nr:hypothetical protein HDU93_005426 [Gonapodya sp. JEL0774]